MVFPAVSVPGIMTEKCILMMNRLISIKKDEKL